MKPGRTMRKGLMIMTALAALLVIIGLLYLRLSFSESETFRRGSIKYRLLIDSDVVRGFPWIKGVDEELIFYSAADGGKPLENSVELKKHHGPLTFELADVDQYLRTLGFAGREPFDLTKSEWEYERKTMGDRVEVDIWPDSGRSAVIIRHYRALK